MRKLFILTTAALLVLAPITLGFGAGPASAQSQPFSVTVETPEEFSTDGKQTIVVNVTNNENTDLLNPVIEVPIQSSWSLAPNQSAATDNVYIDGTTGSPNPTASVTASTFTGGDSLQITGAEVPAGESRTYHFNVSASNPSTTTITADVRPLYNQNNNVRSSTTADILGTGTLDVTVEDINGNTVGDASAVIDGQPQGANVAPTVVEGEHEVAVQGLDGDYPNFTVDVGVGETDSVTFIERDSTQQIQPVAYTEDDVSRVTDSVSRNAGGPETKVNTTVSYTFAKSSGTVIYEVQQPDVPVQNNGTVTVASGGNLVATDTTSDGTRQLEVNETGRTTQVDVVYEGYKLGDIDRDGTVDGTDAEAVAGNVAAGSTSDTVYADVNDDGVVTPVDAMLIAQYSNGSDPSGYTGVN